LVTLLYLAVK